MSYNNDGLTNLLEETREKLAAIGKEPNDIIFIGSADGKYRCSWKEYEVIANVEYDAGYGGQEVAYDLIILFADGSRMVRKEYDGAESWEEILNFTWALNTLPIVRLVRGSWDSIEELQREEEEV